ncbi:outer membrane protein assembly factor BamB family protein [Leptospira sp. GIMC2001]|uniref:outer membrane protein assembly factor BamB family protein n=1 Tax=Leptospira sp. GIMC2001 TaxID=1513297 RepID=UPI00234B3F72|nr:PQQ-binding-like beta-propeller repeat protein [Leptospira sp. GIMC2001]WCL48371.1 PQQ-binding-like beta-propeller repeat protein [Leptospira sp. GIMC2001]
MAFTFRELKEFDPKTRLRVDEVFHLSSAGLQADDPLGDLLVQSHSPGEAPGQAFQDFRTKGHITAGLVQVESPKGGQYFLSLNHRGEVILFEVKGGKAAPSWNITIPGAFYRGAVIVDGIAFVVTKQGTVTGLKLNWDAEGKPLEPETIWQRAMNQTVFSKLLSTGKVLIVASMNSIHAYDCYAGGVGETGKLGRKLWETRISGSVSSPEIGRGSVFIGCEDRHIYSYSYSADGLSSGWKVKTDGPIRSKPYLAKKGSFLLAGSMDGVLYAVEPNAGKILWTFPARNPIHSDIISFMEGNDEYFLFGNDSGTVFCLNFYGKEQWKYNTDGRIRSEFLIHENNVYFGSEDNHLYGLNKMTGKLVLKYATEGNINGSPIIFDNRLFVGSTDCFIHGIFV